MYYSKKELFKKNKVKIKISGKRDLGSVIGRVTFTRQYVDEIVTQLPPEIKILSHNPFINKKCLRYIVHCFFTTGFKHKVTYLMRRTCKINEEL